MKRVIAVALACSLAGAGDFAILNLRVVEGEGIVYPLGGRATRGITVEVTDETGRAVPGVTVSFRLPEEGPSGTFSTGARTDVVTTRQDGRVSVWGMKWNRTAGPVQVKITAAKDGVRAGLVSTQYLAEAGPSAKASGPEHGGGHSRLLLIGLAVAGAAGGGLAMGMSKGAKPATVPPVVTLSVGAPSVIVGGPQ